jgi:hypothetical protein
MELYLQDLRRFAIFCRFKKLFFLIGHLSWQISSIVSLISDIYLVQRKWAFIIVVTDYLIIRCITPLFG